MFHTQLKDDWFMGELLAGTLGAALSVILPLLFGTGLVPMSIIIILLSLAALWGVSVSGSTVQNKQPRTTPKNNAASRAAFFMRVVQWTCALIQADQRTRVQSFHGTAEYYRKASINVEKRPPDVLIRTNARMLPPGESVTDV
jgi:hypothetical protein